MPFDILGAIAQSVALPIYSKGQNIGHMIVGQAGRTCQGDIEVYSDYAADVRAGKYPMDTWTTQDWLGTQTVGAWCAKNGIIPKTATVIGNQVSIPSINASSGGAPLVFTQTPDDKLVQGANIKAATPLVLPPLSLPSLADLAGPVTGALSMTTVVVGGAALFLLLMSRR